jgi:squalene-hopene/tetraprenyl-beta-curcumene cyclase
LALVGAEQRVGNNALRLVINDALARAVQWLVTHQNADGGWSGAAGAASSMEETGLATEALAAAGQPKLNEPAVQNALERGGAWLATAIEQEQWHTPAPIGFYFAKLWYYERLYPLIFATGALMRLVEL